GRQLAEEVFDQGRLADAGLAGHAQEQPLTSLRRLEGATQLREFFLATYGMTFDGGNRWTRRPTRLRTGQLRSRPGREDPAQIRGEVPCGGVALLLALRQRIEARPSHLGRDVADELWGRLRLVVTHLPQQLQRVGRPEGQAAGEHLVEDHAQAVDVGA